jgi:hypothetical protein
VSGAKRELHAELLPDGGAAASSEDFFRSPDFLEAEGTTHTLAIEAGGGALLAPVIVRKVGDGPEVDAISPYGYPGLTLSGRASSRSAGTTAPAAKVDPGEVDFSGTGLVSAFIRHTLGEPPLAATSERNVVQIADPALPAKRRTSDRQQIRRNIRRGYEVEVLAGPESDAGRRAGFLAAYEQTMGRAGAAETYFFGARYFDRILRSPASWLVLATAPDGTIAAASIAVRSDGFMHYFLSGSTDSHLGDSPMKNVVSSLVEHAAGVGLPLNLGGGLTRGDRLEEFKRGFANREQGWHSSEIVCDQAAYARLSGGRDGGGFFPAYRLPR